MRNLDSWAKDLAQPKLRELIDRWIAQQLNENGVGSSVSRDSSGSNKPMPCSATRLTQITKQNTIA